MLAGRRLRAVGTTFVCVSWLWCYFELVKLEVRSLLVFLKSSIIDHRAYCPMSISMRICSSIRFHEVRVQGSFRFYLDSFLWSCLSYLNIYSVVCGSFHTPLLSEHFFRPGYFFCSTWGTGTLFKISGTKYCTLCFQEIDPRVLHGKGWFVRMNAVQYQCWKSRFTA